MESVINILRQYIENNPHALKKKESEHTGFSTKALQEKAQQKALEQIVYT